MAIIVCILLRTTVNTETIVLKIQSTTCSDEWQIRSKGNYPFKHSDDVFGVVKRTDLVVTSAVDDGHRLQADALHGNLWRQQKPMIEIIEKLISAAKYNQFNTAKPNLTQIFLPFSPSL